MEDLLTGLFDLVLNFFGDVFAEWMRRLAERDYVARIAQNTLAPQIYVDFSGPITKEADTDDVMGHVVEKLKDAIATMPEGVPG